MEAKTLDGEPGGLSTLLRAALPVVPGINHLPGVRKGPASAFTGLAWSREGVVVERDRVDAYAAVCGFPRKDVVPLTAVKTIGEVVDDPGTAERDMIVEADYGDLGVLRMFGQPIKLSATPATPARTANRFAEHADRVLAEFAGYDAARIAELRAAGALP